jgi:hypothetical protein
MHPEQSAAVISCRRLHLEARCRERGYTLDDVRACIVSEDGDQITVDETHKAYPSGSGPGTELKKLLAGWPFRIVATPDCKCTTRARYMDAQGCDWCESPDGMAEIMGFLRESAAERGLPFVDMAGRMLVRRAINNARKAEARRAKEAEAAAAAEGPAA